MKRVRKSEVHKRVNLGQLFLTRNVEAITILQDKESKHQSIHTIRTVMSNNENSKKDAKVDVDDDKYAKKSSSSRHHSTVWFLVILVVVAILGALYIYDDFAPEKQGINLNVQNQKSHEEPSDPVGESLTTSVREIETKEVEVTADFDAAEVKEGANEESFDSV